jgi:hypothetical protein
MHNAFYKTEPRLDTPYRQLSLDNDSGKGWYFRLIAGEKAGREFAQELSSTRVETFDEGREIYDKMYLQLEQEGWKVYSPH